MPIFIQLALILLLNLPLYGETDNIIVLNREKVISLAKENSLRLAQSDLALIRNKEKVKMNHFWQSRPSLEFEGGFRQGGSEHDRAIYLRQELDLSQKHRLVLAKSELELTKKDIALIKRDVIVNSLSTFYEALYVMNQKQLAEENVLNYEETYKISKLKHAAGEIGELDLTVSKIALGKSRSILTRKKARYSEILYRLRNFLFLPNHIEVELSGEIKWGLIDDNPNFKINLDRHPLMSYHHSALEKARADYSLVNSEYKPKIELGAGYENEEGENKALLSLGIHFGASGKSHAMEMAHSKVLEEELKLEKAKKGLFIKVEGTKSNYLLLKKALEDYMNGSLLHVQNNEILIEKRYRSGDLPLSNLLSIRRELLESKEELLNLKYEMVIAAIALSKVACYAPFELTDNKN